MVKLITYVAEDGTRFSNEKDCYEYEKSCVYQEDLSVLGNQLQLFDHSFNSTIDVEQAFFVFAITEKAKTVFKYLCKQDGIDIPDTSDCCKFFFDEYTNTWRNFNDLYSRLDEASKVFKQAMHNYDLWRLENA